MAPRRKKKTGPKKSYEQLIAMRISHEQLDRVDDLADLLSDPASGHAVNRSDVMRRAIAVGLDLLLEEYHALRKLRRARKEARKGGPVKRPPEAPGDAPEPPDEAPGAPGEVPAGEPEKEEG